MTRTGSALDESRIQSQALDQSEVGIDLGARLASSPLALTAWFDLTSTERIATSDQVAPVEASDPSSPVSGGRCSASSGLAVAVLKGDGPGGLIEYAA